MFDDNTLTWAYLACWLVEFANTRISLSPTATRLVHNIFRNPANDAEHARPSIYLPLYMITDATTKPDFQVYSCSDEWDHTPVEHLYFVHGQCTCILGLFGSAHSDPCRFTILDAGERCEQSIPGGVEFSIQAKPYTVSISHKRRHISPYEPSEKVQHPL